MQDGDACDDDDDDDDEEEESGMVAMMLLTHMRMPLMMVMTMLTVWMILAVMCVLSGPNHPLTTFTGFSCFMLRVSFAKCGTAGTEPQRA